MCSGIVPSHRLTTTSITIYLPIVVLPAISVPLTATVPVTKYLTEQWTCLSTQLSTDISTGSTWKTMHSTSSFDLLLSFQSTSSVYPNTPRNLGINVHMGSKRTLSKEDNTSTSELLMELQPDPKNQKEDWHCSTHKCPATYVTPNLSSC